LKFKLILVTVLALGGMSYAQGFLSNLSVSAGFQGVFPGATFNKSAAEVSTTSAVTQDTTKSVGVTADARYEFGHHSALDLSLTVNRSTEITDTSYYGLPRVQSNDSEFIGAYVFRLPSNPKVKPYALIGGGMVHFSPNGTAYTTGVIPASSTKPAFAYGFGADFPFNDRWALRLQYRGLVRSDPDFGLLNNANTPFGTGLKTHVAEPSIQIVYHF
jgi:opacity protein-like surface antigen